MDIWYWALSYCCSVVIFYCTGKYIVGIDVKDTYKVTGIFSAVCLSLIFVLSFMHLYLNGFFEILTTVTNIAAFLSALTLLRRKRDVFILIVIVVVFMVIEGLLITLLYLMAGISYNVNEPANLLLNFISEAICAALVVIIATIRDSSKYDIPVRVTDRKPILVLTGAGFLSLSVYSVPLIVMGSRAEGQLRMQATIGLLASCIIFIAAYFYNYFNFVRKEMYSAENRRFKTYIESQKQYYEKLLEEDKKVRAIRHDMRAHLQCIAGFFNSEDIDNGLNYISSLLDEFSVGREKKISGNHIVDTVLSQIDQDKTPVTIKGKFPSEVAMEDVDICILISNLLQNAVDAVLSGQGGGPIEFGIKHMERNLLLEVSNPVAGKVKFHKGLPVRQHYDDNRGFGIKNICNVVAKYSGTFEFSQKGDCFTADIVLYDCID